MNGITKLGDKTTFWSWLISIVLQVVLPLLGVPLPAQQEVLGATLAGGPALIGLQGVAARLKSGKSSS